MSKPGLTIILLALTGFIISYAFASWGIFG